MKIKLALAAVVALTTATVSFPQSALAGEHVCLNASGTVRSTWVTGKKTDNDYHTTSPITRYDFRHESRQGSSSISGNPIGKTKISVHSWVNPPSGKTKYYVTAYCN